MSPIHDEFADDLALHMPLDGMQLIEASAGTGKTYTVAGLYARLVVERGMEPARILVMTFTRAATDELRRRLRGRIATCVRVAEAVAGQRDMPTDNESSWAHALLRRHLEQGQETAEAVLPRLRGVLRSMDEAAIFTIHGFCQRVLGEFSPWLGSVVPDAEMQPDDRDLIEEFAGDFWLRVAGAGKPLELEALRELAASPRELAGKLAELATFDGIVEVSGSGADDIDAARAVAERDVAWERLFAVWRDQGEAAVAAFLDALRKGGLNGTQFRRETSERRIVDLHADIVLGRRPTQEELQRFAQSKILSAGNAGAVPFPGHAAFAAIDDCIKAEQRVVEALQSLKAALARRAREDAIDWLAARKRALMRQTYDDLVTGLAEGLRGAHRERLAQELYRRYPVALLDEFQDTDARQFGIFEAIYACRGGLFMIGDPKQAIYGFRGGDLHAYLRVASRKGMMTHTLRRNFRSSPAMLAAVEALFSQVEHPFLDDGVRFEHVEPGGEVADGALRLHGKPVSPLTLWPQSQKLGADARRDAMARACAAQISELLRHGTLDGAPIERKRIAVLTNSNDEVTQVQDALSRLGVASACVRQESVYSTREATELLRLLDALLAPQSPSRARAALATRLLGRNLSDLARMAGDEAVWRHALDELADLHDRWFGRGILAMLERVGEQHAARLLSLPDGERCLGNLLQLGEALQADMRGLAGERALRDRLAERMADADRRKEDEQLRLESDAERVQVLTLHRSKGLEFDVVFLPFACLMKLRQVKKGRLLDFHRDESRVKYWLLDASAGRSEADTAAITAAQHDEMAERLRCFYVGVTRARHACWVSSGGEIFRQLLRDDGCGLALAAENAAIDLQTPALHGEHVPFPRVASLLDARSFDGEIVRDWRRHSFSALTRGEHDYGAGKRDEPDGYDDGDTGGHEVIEVPGGTRYGTAVHAILEKTGFAAWRDRTDAPPGEQPLLERELRAQGFAMARGRGEAIDGTARLLAATLNTPIMAGLRLADLPDAARRAELEFHFGIRGADVPRVISLLHDAGYQHDRNGFAGVDVRLRGLMNGIIDLVFVHEGRWYIVDYKTNHLGRRYRDYAPERLREAVAKSDYDLQYLIYTVALHRWLRSMPGLRWNFEHDFGGVRYLFLRGLRPGSGAEYGVHADRPSAALIEALDDCLAAGDGR